jgi:dTDP-4-amino-4,6-dideoxygalactose transaminase
MSQVVPPSLVEAQPKAPGGLRSGWVITGPRTQQFAAEFQSRVEAPSTLALNSASGALYVGLLALGIQPGDEVITTPLTSTACANVIEQVGAIARFADVEPHALTLDPLAVESVLTARTRAILAVHYAGHPVELDSLHDIARQHGIGLLEDAGPALLSSYKGRLIGSGQNPVAFSLEGRKSLSTGEGGMLTGSTDLIRRAREISPQNMSDNQADNGLAQLRQLAEIQRRRRGIAATYTAAFRDLDALETPVERPEVEHAWNLYVLRLRLGALRIDRKQFIQELRARNIGASAHFIPLHLQLHYRDKLRYAPSDFPVALGNYQRMLSLPLHPGLSDSEIAVVIDAVADVVSRFSR